MKINLYNYQKRFILENGQTLPGFELTYHTYGQLNEEKNNIIWVCHALTANSKVSDWWEGLFGAGKLYDPENYFIICVNNLGSCYGSTGPLSIHPDTGQPWYAYFPFISIRDIAASLEILRQHLQIDKLHTLIGGSMGGQITQEWVSNQNNLTEHLILIATNAKHSPWGIAFNESQRLAIKADRTYYANLTNGGEKGLFAARSIALLSYRSYGAYQNTQTEENYSGLNNFKAASYQRHQGQKLVERFNAYSYVTLLNAMDSHHLARNRNGNLESILQDIEAKTLVIGINSDQLFPNSEQEFLAQHIPYAEYAELKSEYGHDGFLIETKQLQNAISRFYNKKFTKPFYLNKTLLPYEQNT